MNEDTQEKEDSPKKPHDPMGRATQPGIVDGKITAGQTPCNQTEDDEPGVVCRDLDTQNSEESQSFHLSYPYQLLFQRGGDFFGGSFGASFHSKEDRMALGIQKKTVMRIPNPIEAKMV